MISTQANRRTFLLARLKAIQAIRNARQTIEQAKGQAQNVTFNLPKQQPPQTPPNIGGGYSGNNGLDGQP